MTVLKSMMHHGFQYCHDFPGKIRSCGRYNHKSSFLPENLAATPRIMIFSTVMIAGSVILVMSACSNIHVDSIPTIMFKLHPWPQAQGYDECFGRQALGLDCCAVYDLWLVGLRPHHIPDPSARRPFNSH